MMPKKKKPKKSTTTSHSFREKGIAVRIYRRGSSPVWTASFRIDGRKVQRSTEEEGLDAAKGAAKRMVADELRDSLQNVQPGADLTLGQLFAAYRRHHLPTLSKARRKEAESRILMFTEAWGADMLVADVDPSRIRLYCRKRRSLEILAPVFRKTEEGKNKRGYREPQPVRDGGLDAEFRWLNSALNFATEHRVDGQPLLARNPLPRSAKKRRAMGWPKEKNPRTPGASHQRFLATLKHVDTVDPEGRLRCILELARWTGRRESAICALRAADLLLSRARVLATLAEEGLNEGLADHMPHGAIRWSPESDKQGILFVSPIGAEARAALDLYLSRNPRVGDVPLFPAPGPMRKKGAPPPKGTEKPISRHLSAKWLVKAEEHAKLPKLRGGVFHPFRRLWANERKHLPAVDVAAAGGWSDTQALTRIYQQADPVGVLEAVTTRQTG